MMTHSNFRDALEIFRNAFGDAVANELDRRLKPMEQAIELLKARCISSAGSFPLVDRDIREAVADLQSKHESMVKGMRRLDVTIEERFRNLKLEMAMKPKRPDPLQSLRDEVARFKL